MYLNPRPTPDGLSDFYPNEYYAYVSPTPHELWARNGIAARVWYAAVKGLLADGYGYAHLQGSPQLGRFLARLPIVRARATHKLGIALHPWRPAGSLLDVGCGSGDYLDLMRALGWSRVVGVDISEGAVAQARAIGLEAYAGELFEIDFPDDSFDAILLSHTLEHVHDPVGVLREVARVTVPGGRIAIIVPNARSVAARLFGRYWLGWESPRHLTNFSPGALELVATRAGLLVESCSSPPSTSYQVALFSLSRALGDPHSVYGDSSHRFALRRRFAAGLVFLACAGLSALGRRAGDRLDLVARA